MGFCRPETAATSSCPTASVSLRLLLFARHFTNRPATRYHLRSGWLLEALLREPGVLQATPAKGSEFLLGVGMGIAIGIGSGILIDSESDADSERLYRLQSPRNGRAFSPRRRRRFAIGRSCGGRGKLNFGRRLGFDPPPAQTPTGRHPAGVDRPTLSLSRK